jgi:hypothetical protein
MVDCVDSSKVSSMSLNLVHRAKPSDHCANCDILNSKFHKTWEELKLPQLIVELLYSEVNSCDRLCDLHVSDGSDDKKILNN